ncbi:hypothetical protein [Agromyces sp. NPDC056965]|uniref:hypothetical protein n=1 Tax=Agromyces sp. NPDC056965 TaxID=3345983 RepID=UPI00362B2D61
MATKSLTFDIYGRDKNASTTIRKVGDEADNVGGQFKRMGAVAAAGLAVAAAGAIKFGADSVKAYAEAEQAQSRLAYAYEQFPALADVNIEAMRRLNSEMAKKTRYDDDAFALGQAQLAQYGLTGQQIMDLTPLLADYAGKTGKDLPSAAEDLGKALLGQGRALKDIGIDFEDTGSVAGNLDAIMQGLRTQVGGFAETDATTAAGKLDILRNAFGEVQEKVGESLMPTLADLADWINDEGIPALEGFLTAMELDGAGPGLGPLLPDQDRFRKGDQPDMRTGPSRLFGQIGDVGEWFADGNLFNGTELQKIWDSLADHKGLLGDWLPTGEEWGQYWLDNKTISVQGIEGVRGGMGGGLTAMGADMDVFRSATGAKFGGTWMDADGRTRSGVGAVAASTGNGLLDTMGRILGFSGQVAPQFGSAWAGADSATAGGWGNIERSTGAGVGKVGTKVGEIPGVVKSPFGNAGSWLFGAGEDIVSGLINGLRGMIGDAADTAARLAAATVKAAKDALGIHSPSKVFEEIGTFVGAGFDKGLESSMRNTRSVVEGLVAAPSSMSVSGPSGAGLAAASVAPAPAEYHFHMQPIRDNDPRTTAILLGREFARAAAK